MKWQRLKTWLQRNNRTARRENSFRPTLEVLETRLAPIIGTSVYAPSIPPGTVSNGVDMDGVVMIVDRAGEYGTGSLLNNDGLHILTAAHVINPSPAQTITFNLPPTDTGVVVNPVHAVPPIVFNVPAGPGYQTVPASFVPGHPERGSDIGILNLTDQAPGMAAVNRLEVAPYYGPGNGAQQGYTLVANNANDFAPNIFTVAGYGRTGTGNIGSVPNTGEIKRLGANTFDAAASILDNAVQYIGLQGVNGGFFQLTFTPPGPGAVPVTTGPIPWNSNGPFVQASLVAAVPSLDGNVVVTGGPGFPTVTGNDITWFITFTNALGGQVIPQVRISSASRPNGLRGIAGSIGLSSGPRLAGVNGANVRAPFNGALAFDFDNGLPLNDALGLYYGITGTGVPKLPEIQTLANQNGPNYTLTLAPLQTAPGNPPAWLTTAQLAWNAPANASLGANSVQAALEAILGVGNVAVAPGGAAGQYTITFQGAFAGMDLNQLTARNPATGTFSPNVTIATTQNGRADNISTFGDSGGPAFINGQIAAVVSGSVDIGKPPDVNTIANNDTFGGVGVMTSVAPFLPWINSTIDSVHPSRNGGAQQFNLVLDMAQQALGNDGVADPDVTITAQLVDGNLVLSVEDPNSPYYSGIYYSGPIADISSLTIRGALPIGDPAHDYTTVVLDRGVVAHLAGQINLRDPNIDDVQIDGGELKADDPLLLRHLELITGKMDGNSPIDIIKSSSWTGGTMADTGTTTITAGATFTIDGAATKTLTDRTLQNAGTLTWTAGDITGYTGTIDNLGVFSGQGNFAGTLDNEGLFYPGGIGTIGSVNVIGNYADTGTLNIDLSGSTNDQVIASGNVALGGNLALYAPSGFSPSVGTVYTIINNTGYSSVGGTFAGLPEGAVFGAVGTTFQISYKGGDGNNVTLTVVAAATHLVVSAPSPVNAGSSFTFTVTAQNSSGSTLTSYSGTLGFSSSDGLASLPGHSTLVNGTGTFTATLNTEGVQLIFATDLAHSTLVGVSNPITVNAATPTHFNITLLDPGTDTAGAVVNFQVTALDPEGNIDTGYNGTVQFTSSDSQASLPGTASLTGGIGYFQATLVKSGSQTIGVTGGTLTSSTVSITVSTGTVSQFAISTPSDSTAGTGFAFTVTAEDAFNNTLTGYTGTVAFSSADGLAGLPANATLVSGVGVFSATLSTEGSQDIDASDTDPNSLASGSATVDVAAATSLHLVVSAPDGVVAGQEFTLTVTAEDTYNNVASSYAGTVHFTSGDTAADLPANAALTDGEGEFDVTLNSTGTQTITATDTVHGTITGTAEVAVEPQLIVALPSTVTAGTSFTFTVTAEDAVGHTDTSYGGTVEFGSSDGQATLPADSALSSGAGTFTATLATAGEEEIFADDTEDFSIFGSDTVTVVPAAASQLVITTSGAPDVEFGFPITVTALDPFNNVATGFGGTVGFTSSDSTATLPGGGGLTSGTGTFSATLNTTGTQTITATGTGGITGTADALGGASFTIAVSAATAGAQFGFTVTAFDANGNTATGYSGTVGVTSSDSTASFAGMGSFSHGVGAFSGVLTKAGSSTTLTVASGTVTSGAVSVYVNSGSATQFTVTGPTTATAGSAAVFTVTAKDQFGNTVNPFLGTVHFTSDDTTAVLPGNATFANGIGTFSTTLKTSGSQAINASETSSTAVTGSLSLTVNPAAASHFTVTAPSTMMDGYDNVVIVTAFDQFNNTASGYGGTVHFTSTDAAATLPANGTLTSGIGGFFATLNTSGNQTITATDTVTSSIAGHSGVISVSASSATHFVVTAPATYTAGHIFSFTVTALDQFNNKFTGYAGTVQFATSDANYFSLSDPSPLTSGVGIFAAFLRTAGSQTITASDSRSPAISGNSASITIVGDAPTHFVIGAPLSATAGNVLFTVTGEDQYNNTSTGYHGTVHFTSTDGQAVLPSNTTLTSGVGSFSMTLKTPGSQTLTAADTTTSSITGHSGTITVSPGAPTQIFLSGSNATVTAGDTIVETAIAYDAYNNVATNFSGGIAVTSSDGNAILPTGVAFTSGVATFNATLTTAGTQSITVVENANSSVNCTASNITVNVGALTQFTFTGVPTDDSGGVTYGEEFEVTAYAADAWGNVVTSFSGDVTYSSNDSWATFYLYGGYATFSSGSLNIALAFSSGGAKDNGGTCTFTLTSNDDSSITGSFTVSVNPPGGG